MRVNQVNCDGCELDITTTGNYEDWRLVLDCEPKTLWFIAEGKQGGAVTDMALSPPVDRAYHFCGIGCLVHWLAEKHPDAAARYEQHVKHQLFLAQRKATHE